MTKTAKENEYLRFTGSAIRELRRKYTSKSLCIFAYENDVPRSTLSRIESGQNEAQLLTLKKIAEGFGWDLSVLFKKIEELSPKEISIKDE